MIQKNSQKGTTHCTHHANLLGCWSAGSPVVVPMLPLTICAGDMDPALDAGELMVAPDGEATIAGVVFVATGAGGGGGGA